MVSLRVTLDSIIYEWLHSHNPHSFDRKVEKLLKDQFNFTRSLENEIIYIYILVR